MRTGPDVLQSITENQYELSGCWLWASEDIYTADYREILQQPTSLEATTIDQCRFKADEVVLVARSGPEPDAPVVFACTAYLLDDTDSIPTTATDHASLSGLLGTGPEYVHLNSAQQTGLVSAGDTALHYHAADRNRAYHTGTQLAATISDFASAADARIAAQKGAQSGLATLDTNTKIPLSQIPDALIGQVKFQALWNQTTNSPTLPATPAAGTKGYYWICTDASQATFQGLVLNTGDWLIVNGNEGALSWGKVDNTDSVTSVFGRTGTITAQAADYAAFYQPLKANLTALSGGQTNAFGVANGVAATNYFSDALAGDTILRWGAPYTEKIRLGVMSDDTGSNASSLWFSASAAGSNYSFTAASFVKSGGTSSQFLKADGSVDSTSYATASSLGNYLPLSAGSGKSLTGTLYGTAMVMTMGGTAPTVGLYAWPVVPASRTFIGLTSQDGTGKSDWTTTTGLVLWTDSAELSAKVSVGLHAGGVSVLSATSSLITLGAALSGTTAAFGNAAMATWTTYTNNAWFGKTGYNTGNLNGFVADGTNTWCGATSGGKVGLQINGLPIVSATASAVTLSQPLSGTSATFSAGVVASSFRSTGWAANTSYLMLNSPTSYWAGIVVSGSGNQQTQMFAQVDINGNLQRRSDIAANAADFGGLVYSNAYDTSTYTTPGFAGNWASTGHWGIVGDDTSTIRFRVLSSANADAGSFANIAVGNVTATGYYFPSINGYVGSAVQSGFVGNQFNVTCLRQNSSSDIWAGLSNERKPGIVYRARTDGGAYSNDYQGWIFSSSARDQATISVGNGTSAWNAKIAMSFANGITLYGDTTIVADNGLGTLTSNYVSAVNGLSNGAVLTVPAASTITLSTPVAGRIRAITTTAVDQTAYVTYGSSSVTVQFVPWVGNSVATAGSSPVSATGTNSWNLSGVSGTGGYAPRAIIEYCISSTKVLFVCG